MRLDDLPTSDNVRDLGRGRGGGGLGGGGMGGMLGMILPLVGRKFGCLGIGVVLVLMVVFGGGLSLFGGGGGQQVAGTGSTAAPGATDNAATACSATPVRKATCQVMYSTEQVWGGIFQQEGQQYRPATLNFYDGQNQSGCGAAMAAMGPFYCPTDQGVYIDTSFFDELATKYRAQGDFAQDYVVAHEVGHHIQALTGIADRVRQAQSRAGTAEANALQVRMELQADCYAGVWGARATDAQGRRAIEPGDVEEGLTAAAAIGDDTLQRQSGGRVSPESFTHGSSEQRMRWLRRGLESADPAACDTFAAGAV